MDIEKTREIIYHPLKKQRLPKYIKHNFDKFALSTYDMLYPFEMYQFRNYLNQLLDKLHKNYRLADETDDSIYIDAIRLSTTIYNKLYEKSWTF